MSELKSIWHTDDEKPQDWRLVYNDPKNKRWAYLDDIEALETELERTRKALDVAVGALKDNLSQANFREMLDASRFHCIRTKCELALDQIQELEQKDVK